RQAPPREPLFHLVGRDKISCIPEFVGRGFYLRRREGCLVFVQLPQTRHSLTGSVSQASPVAPELRRQHHVFPTVLRLADRKDDLAEEGLQGCRSRLRAAWYPIVAELRQGPILLGCDQIRRNTSFTLGVCH